MSKDVFDNELHNHLKDDLEFKCTECDKPIEKEGVCSFKCHQASMI